MIRLPGNCAKLREKGFSRSNRFTCSNVEEELTIGTFGTAGSIGTLGFFETQGLEVSHGA